jgi:hypothetical protein
MSNPSWSKTTKVTLHLRELNIGLPFVALAKNGSDEIGGFEDFEVSFGGVVPLGAVDDGFGGSVPGNLLE